LVHYCQHHLYINQRFYVEMVLFWVIMRCFGHRPYEKLQFQVVTVLISGCYAAVGILSLHEFAVSWGDGLVQMG